MLSSQAGSSGSDSQGTMIYHGFEKKMRFLEDGEDVYHRRLAIGVYVHRTRSASLAMPLPGQK
jgi:hypothetical protein